MRYEIIDEYGAVVNTIVSEPEFMHANYKAGTYRAVIEPVIEKTPVAKDTGRRIFVGSFFDRFGAAKWGILADTNPVVQALIKDASVRKYIDLTDVSLQAGVQMVIDAGHNITIEDVINAPIQKQESYDYDKLLKANVPLPDDLVLAGINV